jgi:hypothetical protein
VGGCTTEPLIELDAGGDLGEQPTQGGTEQGDGDDDDDRNKSDHEAVLDGSCAAVVVDSGLEFDETREHFGPLLRAGALVQEGILRDYEKRAAGCSR